MRSVGLTKDSGVKRERRALHNVALGNRHWVAVGCAAESARAESNLPSGPPICALLPRSSSSSSSHLPLLVVPAQLTALNLSDNALGEKGVRACEAVLKGKVGWVQEGAKHVWSLVGWARERAQHVWTLRRSWRQWCCSRTGQGAGAGYNKMPGPSFQFNMLPLISVASLHTTTPVILLPASAVRRLTPSASPLRPPLRLPPSASPLRLAPSTS